MRNSSNFILAVLGLLSPVILAQDNSTVAISAAYPDFNYNLTSLDPFAASTDIITLANGPPDITFLHTNSSWNGLYVAWSLYSQASVIENALNNYKPVESNNVRDFNWIQGNMNLTDTKLTNTTSPWLPYSAPKLNGTETENFTIYVTQQTSGFEDRLSTFLGQPLDKSNLSQSGNHTAFIILLTLLDELSLAEMVDAEISASELGTSLVEINFHASNTTGNPDGPWPYFVEGTKVGNVSYGYTSTLLFPDLASSSVSASTTGSITTTTGGAQGVSATTTYTSEGNFPSPSATGTDAASSSATGSASASSSSSSSSGAPHFASTRMSEMLAMSLVVVLMAAVSL